MITEKQPGKMIITSVIEEIEQQADFNLSQCYDRSYDHSHENWGNWSNNWNNEGYGPYTAWDHDNG